MAELTHLEEKLAEVTGLAMAAEAAGGKISKLTEEEDESGARPWLPASKARRRRS